MPWGLFPATEVLRSFSFQKKEKHKQELMRHASSKEFLQERCLGNKSVKDLVNFCFLTFVVGSGRKFEQLGKFH